VSTVVLPRSTWHRLSTALLDGDHPWGAIVSSPARYGASRHRLVVYPPGITKQERRWLRVWRGWFGWGGLLWLVLYVGLLQITSPVQAMTVSCGVCVTAGAAAFVMAGDAKHRVRTLHASVFAGCADPVLVEGQRAFRLLTTTLVTAHAMHRRGELSAVDYERVWWEVYDAMAPEPRTV